MGQEIRINGHQAEWVNNRLVFAAAAIESLTRPHFSPSSAKSNDIDSCQARWAAERLLPDDDNPLLPAPLGTVVHSIAELLFRSLPCRQPNEIIDIAIETILAGHSGSTVPLPQPDQVEEWRSEVAVRAAGLRTLDFPNIEVLGTEERVTGAIDGIEFLGYIDLRVRLADGSIVIVDAKSGKPEQPPKPSLAGDHRRDIWLPQHDFQIQLYELAIRASGLLPMSTRGAVLYSRTGKWVDVDFGPDAMANALKRWHRAHARLTRFLETGQAATRPSPWCSRCPIGDSCPVKYQSKKRSK